MKLKIKKKTIIMVLACVVFLWPLFSRAADYDYYVDRSVSKSGDGSQKEPFKSINDAMKKANGKKGSRNIFIKRGDYKENVEIKKSVKLYGENEGGVIITGKIRMNDGTRLENITVRDGGNSTVVVMPDASVEIENCTVRDFGLIGIESLAGKGKLKVSGSKIIDGDGKGFYVQRGKTVEISGNEVVGNAEEGIDLRDSIKGSVANNIIKENGESGIELIVGSADLKISNNSIADNGSSGIATQFYPNPGLNDKGKVFIENNLIVGNIKYGVDCNIPQGGNPGKDYWRDSIDLIDNNMNANKISSINAYCKFISAVDDDEESDNILAEEGSGAGGSANELSAQELVEEKERQIEAKKEAERRELEAKLAEIESLLAEGEVVFLEAEKEIANMKKRSVIRRFFSGIDRLAAEKSDRLFSESNGRLDQAERLLQEISAEAEWEETIQGRINERREIVRQQEALLDEMVGAFNVTGWMKAAWADLLG